MAKDTNKDGNGVKAAVGIGTAGTGGTIVVKTLKTKKISPKEKVVEIIEKEVTKAPGKKPGEYIYRNAVRKNAIRKNAGRWGRGAAGSNGITWFASKLASETENNNNNDSSMEIRRKVFSRLQDEKGGERLYSTNEFELSYSEEGEKTFSVVDKGKEVVHTVGEKAGKGLVWIKTKTGQWVKVAEKSLKELSGKVAEGTKKATDAVVSGAKEGAGKVAEGAKNVSGKVAAGAKAGAKWVAAHPYKTGAIGLGAAAVGTGAVLGAKQLKKNKENK